MVDYLRLDPPPRTDDIAIWVRNGEWHRIKPSDYAVKVNSSLDHGLLTGLADDDHPQYLKESDFDDVDFLVGTATGHTGAEIVVGTSPGGELGGTWASPTVDATHSGSAHHAQVHDAADHTNRTRSFWLQAGIDGVWKARTGTPDSALRGANTLYNAVAFDGAGALEEIVTNVVMPADYVSGAITVKLRWANAAASSGNVVWTILAVNKAAGDDLNSTTGLTSGNTTVAATATAGVEVLSTMSGFTFTPNAAPGGFLFLVRRNSADASDTLTNDVWLEGVIIEYTADG